LDGWVTSEGVLCGCCKTIVTLSMFEAHCGSKLHRPCANIYVEDGRTLTELQMEALRKHNSSERSIYFHPAMRPGRRQSGITKGKEHAADGNDDTCGVCGDGGMLICCDLCPSTFHLTCMELEAVPEEDWFCPNCRCAICGGPPVNANPDEFNEMVVLSCDQCEREFHLKCLYARGLPKLDQCPTGSWFCGHSCEKIFRDLRRLVGTSNPLEDGYSWTLLRSQEDLELSAMDKETMAEQKIKLAIAFSVMQECFKPMIDPHTKVDIVAHVLYNRGSEVSRLNYCGFYTLILEKGDELISVATVRYGLIPSLSSAFLVGRLHSMSKLPALYCWILDPCCSLLKRYLAVVGLSVLWSSHLKSGEAELANSVFLNACIWQLFVNKW
jgi:hypothetical protein